MRESGSNAGTWNILFLCTGNSARSIIGEALANGMPATRGRFRGYSAGSQPKGAVNPGTLELLHELGLPTDGLRSKSWDEFATPDAPKMDFVITVCDSAAGEACPYWPGQPMTAHWGLPDPAAVEGSDEDRRRAFRETANALRLRLELMASLPMAGLERLTLQQQVRDLAKR